MKTLYPAFSGTIVTGMSVEEDTWFLVNGYIRPMGCGVIHYIGTS